MTTEQVAATQALAAALNRVDNDDPGILDIVAIDETGALRDVVEPLLTALSQSGWSLVRTDRLDDASEYGRLLAERDRLIGEGVDPDDLDLPLEPAR